MQYHRFLSSMRTASQWFGAVVLISIPLLIMFFALAHKWLITTDQPKKSDAIFVLAGNYTRPPYAADLYLQGYANKIFVSRPNKPAMYAELKKLDIHLQKMETVYKKILLAKGVPKSAIITFGHDILSTVEEAETLYKLHGKQLKNLLVVTSPFHARRSKLIFEREMPDIHITVVSTPYEQFPKKWWQNRNAALAVVSETSKTLFYFMGGAFRSTDQNALIYQQN